MAPGSGLDVVFVREGETTRELRSDRGCQVARVRWAGGAPLPWIGASPPRLHTVDAGPSSDTAVLYLSTRADGSRLGHNVVRMVPSPCYPAVGVLDRGTYIPSSPGAATLDACSCPHLPQKPRHVLSPCTGCILLPCTRLDGGHPATHLRLCLAFLGVDGPKHGRMGNNGMKPRA